MQKEGFYKGIKTVGFVSFIPFMLAAGPLAGYFVGDFLQKKLNLSVYVVFAGIVFGFVIGVMETVRILKALARINKK